ncbi:MAG: hypothetical protein HUJ86_00345 [Synergistes sp.]|nr:hypothetical protein [Synergistes sp.]
MPYFIKDNKGYFDKAAGANMVNGAIASSLNLNLPTPRMSFVTTSDADNTNALAALGRNAIHEEAYVRLADGRCVHLVSSGLGMRLTKEQMEMFVGADFNHNHPNSPLNFTDLFTAISNRFNSIAATTSDKIYKVSIPNDVNFSKLELRRKFDDIKKQADQWVWSLNTNQYNELMKDPQLLDLRLFCKSLGLNLQILDLHP